MENIAERYLLLEIPSSKSQMPFDIAKNWPDEPSSQVVGKPKRSSPYVRAKHLDCFVFNICIWKYLQQHPPLYLLSSPTPLGVWYPSCGPIKCSKLATLSGCDPITRNLRRPQIHHSRRKFRHTLPTRDNQAHTHHTHVANYNFRLNLLNIILRREWQTKI